MRAAERGYVLKDDEKDDVLGAIRAGGGAVFGPSVAARLADFFARPSCCSQRSVPYSPTASVRCCTSWRRVPNAEIARLLSLSPKTVANYVSNILHKLQVADRKEAALRAREAGL